MSISLEDRGFHSVSLGMLINIFGSKSCPSLVTIFMDISYNSEPMNLILSRVLFWTSYYSICNIFL